MPRPTKTDLEVILQAREGALRIPTSALLEGGRVLVLSDGELVAREVHHRFLERYAPALSGRWHYRHIGESSHGMPLERFQAFAADAELYLNVSGASPIPDGLGPGCVTAFVDTDPGYNQIVLAERPDWSENVDRWVDSVRAHDRHLTYAENIHGPDCGVPTVGLEWTPTRMPVVPDLWAGLPPPPADAAWTSDEYSSTTSLSFISRMASVIPSSPQHVLPADPLDATALGIDQQLPHPGMPVQLAFVGALHAGLARQRRAGITGPVEVLFVLLADRGDITDGVNTATAQRIVASQARHDLDAWKLVTTRREPGDLLFRQLQLDGHRVERAPRFLLEVRPRRGHGAAEYALERGDQQAFSPENLRAMIDRDGHQIRSMIRLISDMVDVSRIKSGRLSIRPEKTDLSQLLHRVVEGMAQQAQVAGCAIRLAIEENVVGFWDEFRIEQVVINLLTNAYRYGCAKPVDVSLISRADVAGFEPIPAAHAPVTY